MALSFAHMVTFSACLTFLLLVSSFEAAPHERYMYSMGLGKRLYSPYSFGLGKRGGSDRHRFAFGLGKRSSGDVYSEPTDMDEGVVVDRDEDADYWMEEEKRASRPSVYSFGLGKRAKPNRIGHIIPSAWANEKYR